jgi:hypothetical protein
VGIPFADSKAGLAGCRSAARRAIPFAGCREQDCSWKHRLRNLLGYNRIAQCSASLACEDWVAGYGLVGIPGQRDDEGTTATTTVQQNAQPCPPIVSLTIDLEIQSKIVVNDVQPWTLSTLKRAVQRSSILDGYSRYIVNWDIRESTTEADIEIILQC